MEINDGLSIPQIDEVEKKRVGKGWMGFWLCVYIGEISQRLMRMRKLMRKVDSLYSFHASVSTIPFFSIIAVWFYDLANLRKIVGFKNEKDDF